MNIHNFIFFTHTTSSPYSASNSNFILICAFIALLLTGCGSKQTVQTPPSQNATITTSTAPPSPAQVPANTPSTALAPTIPSSNATIHTSWEPLIQQLKIDLPGVPVEQYFYGLKEYSGKPMAVKVKELYTNAFLRKQQPKKPSTTPPSRIYRGFVTQANMDKCNDFLQAHKSAFDIAEERYSVPREVLVSLLLVETKLGTFLGNAEAFWSLASMATATSPNLVKDDLTVTINPQQETWLQSKLDEKSTWAYKELLALVTHCSLQELDPQGMPGSVYGAIGICQFMPSNLDRYTDDGDGDGIINLFNEADAIVSAAKYLSAHGWKTKSSVAEQRKVIKRYNNLNIYANTILTMAESLRTNKVLTTPPK